MKLKIKAIIYSYIFILSSSIKLDNIEYSRDLTPLEGITNIFKTSLYGYGADTLIFFIGIIFLLLKLIPLNNKNTVNNTLRCITSFSLALSMVIGYSFLKTNSFILVNYNFAQFIMAAFKVAGYYIAFYYLLVLVLYLINNTKLTELNKNPNLFERKLFESKSNWRVYLIIFVAWLPALIGYFPGKFMGDTISQILQAWNIKENTCGDVILVSPNIYLNNHHPVFHTLILGMLIRIGRFIFSSDNGGAFFYTFTQYILAVFGAGFSILYMKKKQVPYWFRISSIIFYCCVPYFAEYSVLISKDIIFAVFTAIFTMMLYDITTNDKYENEFFKWFQIGLIAFLLCLFRQTGIYIIIFSLIGAIIIRKKVWKKYLILLLTVFVLFNCYNKILLPAVGISETSVKETLSIPFQQTARYLNYHEDEVTDEEKEAISNVIDYDNAINNYDPLKSDPIKDSFNKYATRQQLIDYFKVWTQMFLKHPGCYVAATVNNYYGYLYPGERSTGNFYTEEYSQICMNCANKQGFDFNTTDNWVSSSIREIMDFYRELFIRLPGVSLFAGSALYFWLIVLGILHCISRKLRNVVLLYIPSITIIITNFAGPCNGIDYFRYIYPIAYCIPVIIGIHLVQLNKQNKKLEQI